MTVNSQITDSITQPNVKVLGDAPAVAMGNLFIATSQALANAAHNATSNQQQGNLVAQAATAQAVSALLSIDTNSESQADSIFLRTMEANRAIEAAVPATPALTPPDFHEIADGVIDAADDVAYGLRSIANAFAASMDALGEATYHNLLRTLQIAATSACLTAMVAQPEKAASYEEVLAAIKRMG